MKKVLVIDDDKVIRESIINRLNADGYTTFELENGKDVVETIKEFNPDVIMLDLSMQDIGGMDCLKFIKNLDEKLLCKVIIMTNSKNEDTMLRALEHGVTTYLNKHQNSLESISKIVEQKTQQICLL
jgi:two-component system chemotaxis response regulator CheY